MKLGEMLVRDGRITERDLDRAIARQQSDGGRLGSIFVEMGLIDAETLTVYLGLELGIPIATGATMERCKRSAVKLLTPDQAARLRCIPIVIQGQTLIVAMDDPHDMWALDELSNLTGYRIIPRVAPEVRVFYYLERFYGVARPPRWAKLGDLPRGNRQTTAEMQGLPAPPLPGLPPRREQPVRAPTPAPVLVRKASNPPAEPALPPPRPPVTMPMAAVTPEELPPDVYEAIEIDAADLLVELDEDEAEVADEAPRTGEASIEVAVASASRRIRPRTEAPATEYERLSLDAALGRIETGDQRGEIADSLLSYAASQYEVALMFMIRDNMAFGWKGFGPQLPPDRIEALLIPLEAPSMFAVAMQDEHLFRGTPFPATLHGYLFKVLNCETPSSSLVVGVSIGKRLVNLIYVHKAGGTAIGDAEITDLRRLTDAAADAYVRLITVSKQKQQAG